MRPPSGLRGRETSEHHAALVVGSVYPEAGLYEVMNIAEHGVNRVYVCALIVVRPIIRGVRPT